MALYFIYPGRMGAGLDTTLSLYEVAKDLGLDARVILSKDNVRGGLVEKVYPEVKFFSFTSINDLLKMKKEISEHWSFFTMISPKMFPLYLSLRRRKLFYFHASYNHSFAKRSMNNAVMDFLHDLTIKDATLTLTTQELLAWQIKIRLNREAKTLPHPPFTLRDGFFAAEKEIPLPFRRYFLYFGDVNREVKGASVLVKALENHPEISAIIAGRGGKIPKKDNIAHLEGWIEDGAMHHMIKKAEAVTLPYLEPAQFSGCLALSFHFRTPVIGSNLPTFHDWIDEDRTGWLFRAGDADALGERMLEVWQGKRKYSKDAIAKKELEMKKRSKKYMKEMLEQVGYTD